MSQLSLGMLSYDAPQCRCYRTNSSFRQNSWCLVACSYPKTFTNPKAADRKHPAVIQNIQSFHSLQPAGPKREPFIRERSKWQPFWALWDPLPLPVATILCCSCHLCKPTDCWHTVKFKGYGKAFYNYGSSWQRQRDFYWPIRQGAHRLLSSLTKGSSPKKVTRRVLLTF